MLVFMSRAIAAFRKLEQHGSSSLDDDTKGMIFWKKARTDVRLQDRLITIAGGQRTMATLNPTIQQLARNTPGDRGSGSYPNHDPDDPNDDGTYYEDNEE